jgi:hypothetical protein
MTCFIEEWPMGEEEGNWNVVQEWWRRERLGVPFLGWRGGRQSGEMRPLKSSVLGETKWKRH